jgi:hypothetical protein
MRKILLIYLGTAIVLHSPDAAAQYSVPHGVFSNGGGVRIGSNYSYDTLGQGATGTSSGGSYSVSSGFWYNAVISSTVDVAIASFHGEYSDDTVILRWSVSADTPIKGFNVYRSDGGAENYVKINPRLLPPESGNEYRDHEVIPGKSYEYVIGVVESEGEILSFAVTISLPPKPLTLYQNCPNPFNPATSISFFLPSPGHVTLIVYDVQGRKVKTLVDADKGVRTHKVTWNGTNDSGNNVSSGIYFYCLVAEKKILTKKLALLR